MKAFLFPGQGSQHVGMGHEIYKAFPVARDVFQEVDEALQQSLSRIIFEGPLDDLTLTENAQPALMVTSMALLKVLEKEGEIDLPSFITCVAGHSLGEYTALCAAGALTLPEAARLLKFRGHAMKEAVPFGEGVMAAILGLELDQVEKIAEEAAQGQVCDIANDNSPGQIVISGNTEAIHRAIDLAQAQGAKRSVLLNVSSPFHSRLMHSAQEKMQEALAHANLTTPCVPVIDNVSATPVKEGEAFRTLLTQQVSGRVRWRESLLCMADLGITETIEIGAGKVLTGLTKRTTPTLTALALNTPEDIDAFLSPPQTHPQLKKG